MNIDPMEQPKTREQFENNFHVLSVKLQNEQIKFSAQVPVTMTGLQEVRLLPNNRIDFLSVNESARLQANMMNHMTKYTDLIQSEHFQNHND